MLGLCHWLLFFSTAVFCVTVGTFACSLWHMWKLLLLPCHNACDAEVPGGCLLELIDSPRPCSGHHVPSYHASSFLSRYFYSLPPPFHNTHQVWTRERNRGMLSSTSIHFAYSFQKPQDGKMRGYIASYFLFMPCRSPAKSHLSNSPFALPHCLDGKWEQEGESTLLIKTVMLRGAPKWFSI